MILFIRCEQCHIFHLLCVSGCVCVCFFFNTYFSYIVVHCQHCKSPTSILLELLVLLCLSWLIHFVCFSFSLSILKHSSFIIVFVINFFLLHLISLSSFIFDPSLVCNCNSFSVIQIASYRVCLCFLPFAIAVFILFILLICC